MRGENKLKVLEFLEASAQTIGDLFFIFTLPYGTSYTKMEYLLRKKRRENSWGQLPKEKRRQFHDLLYHLRRDQLVVEEKIEEKKHFIELTNVGRRVLEKLRLKKANAFPSANQYESLKEDALKIIIFDIPEREKRKRNWLRAVLRRLNFTMLQKSVWLGKTKLPKEFISDLHKIGLLSYVEIFAISRIGSLKQLKP